VVEPQEPVLVMEPVFIEGFADVVTSACSSEWVSGRGAALKAVIAACWRKPKGWRAATAWSGAWEASHSKPLRGGRAVTVPLGRAPPRLRPDGSTNPSGWNCVIKAKTPAGVCRLRSALLESVTTSDRNHRR
jgi:hypothetical protein